VRVQAFGDLLDDLARKRVKVVWISGRDHAVVDDDRLVFPSAARVHYICLDRFAAGQRQVMDKTRFDQQPGRMTDRGERLTGVEKWFSRS
jgi:hypothetical protein